jgi:peptidyl-prolyl cis-trans isomerase C
MKYMNRKSGWLIVTGIAFLVSTSSAFAADSVISEKKAAVVNGVTITMMTLNGEYRQVLKQRRMTEETVTADQVLAVKKEILKTLIDQELLYQECQKNNISIDEENINTSLIEVKESFESEEVYQNALKDANMEERDLSERLKRTLAINELVTRKVSRNVIVTEEETRTYYDTHPTSFQRNEKVRASHILVKVSKDAGEAQKVAAKEKLLEIYRRIEAGEDFAKLAGEHSDCPSSVRGGDLDYFERGKMIPEFEDVAFSMEPGSVSDIVQTDYGFHLIKLTDKVGAGIIAYETVKSELTSFLERQKTSVGVSELIETLRNDAKIETYL